MVSSHVKHLPSFSFSFFWIGIARSPSRYDCTAVILQFEVGFRTRFKNSFVVSQTDLKGEVPLVKLVRQNPDGGETAVRG